MKRWAKSFRAFGYGLWSAGRRRRGRRLRGTGGVGFGGRVGDQREVVGIVHLAEEVGVLDGALVDWGDKKGEAGM